METILNERKCSAQEVVMKLSRDFNLFSSRICGILAILRYTNILNNNNNNNNI